MPRSTDARKKALAVTERLLRTQGYNGTGLTQILDESGAPKGSFYFHFPDGKEQLAREALEAYGAKTHTFIKVLAERYAGQPAVFVAALCEGIGTEMKTSNYRLGCAVQNIANELIPGNKAFSAITAMIMGQWVAVIAEVLLPACDSRKQAYAHATALLAALEGGRVIARIKSDNVVFQQIAQIFIAALNLHHD